MDPFLAELPAAADTCFVAPEAVSWRDVPGEIVLFDSRSNAYHALNPTAAEVWRALGAGLSVRAATDDLARRFGADRGQIERDVIDFIRHALKEALLLPDGGR